MFGWFKKKKVKKAEKLSGVPVKVEIDLATRSHISDCGELVKSLNELGELVGNGRNTAFDKDQYIKETWGVPIQIVFKNGDVYMSQHMATFQEFKMWFPVIFDGVENVDNILFSGFF